MVDQTSCIHQSMQNWVWMVSGRGIDWSTHFGYGSWSICRDFRTWENERHDGTQKCNCHNWVGRLDFQLWDFTLFSLRIPHEIHHFYPFVVTSLGKLTVIASLAPVCPRNLPYALCGKHMVLAKSSTDDLGLKSTGRNFHPLWQTSSKAMAEFQFETMGSFWINLNYLTIKICLGLSDWLEEIEFQKLTFHTI